jgi:hypothetical protein
LLSHYFSRASSSSIVTAVTPGATTRALAAWRTGRSRSDLARDALRRQLAVAQFNDIRRRVMPVAGTRGYLADEDVFRDVS